MSTIEQQAVTAQTVTLTCTTTNQTFDADLTRLRAVNVTGGVAYFWLSCPYCDAASRTPDDPDYDAENPQLVVYAREETTS